MRRFFDYNFDGLELGLTQSSLTPVITPFVLPELFAAFPVNPPLFAEIDGTSDDDVLEGTSDDDTIRGGLGLSLIHI